MCAQLTMTPDCVTASDGAVPRLKVGVAAKAGSDPESDTLPLTGCVTAEPSTLRPFAVPVRPVSAPPTLMPAYCAVVGTTELVAPTPTSFVTAMFGVPEIVTAPIVFEPVERAGSATIDTGCVTAEPSTLRPFVVPVMPVRAPPTLIPANCAVEGTAELVAPTPTSEVTATLDVPATLTVGVPAITALTLSEPDESDQDRPSEPETAKADPLAGCT